MIEGGFLTAHALVWQDKIYKAHPEPSTGNRCAGCAFRDGRVGCNRPEELWAYTCIDSIRSDYRGIIWKESEA